MKRFITARSNILRPIGVAIFWLAVWELAARLVGQKLFLSSPLDTLQTLLRLMSTGSFYKTILASLGRITSGFAAALVLGCLLAATASAWKPLHSLLHPLMAIIQATPVVSFILLALILVGSKNLAALIAMLMVLPIVYTNLYEGTAAIDPVLFEAADVYGMPRGMRLRYIYLPELVPHLSSACTVGLGLAWKSGVAAEVIGITAGSIGEKLYDAKINLITDELFAYTLAVILLSILCEKLLTAGLSAFLRRLFASRRQAQKAA